MSVRRPRLPAIAGGVRRQSGRVLLAFVLILALVGVLGFALIESKSDVLPNAWTIRWLRVDGPLRRVSAEEVRAAVAPYATGGFFQVDLDAIREAAERLPWVKHAVVRKQWPDTVHVRILEHRPMARWDGEALIDRHGELFRVPDGGEIRGLPVLRGPDHRLRDVIARFKSLREKLVGTGLTVRALTLTPRGTWRMRVGHGITIRLGSVEVAARLNRFLDVYREYLAARKRELVRVDLRYPNGFAVKWATDDKVASSGAQVNRLSN